MTPTRPSRAGRALALAAALLGLTLAGPASSRADEPEAAAADAPTPTPPLSTLDTPEAASLADAPAPSPPLSTLDTPEAASPAELDAAAAALLAPEAAEEDESRLRVFGFADFMLYAPFGGKNDPWLQYFHPYSSFLLGNLNVYLAADLGARARSMAEVRFLLNPHGQRRIDAAGEVQRTNTEVLDNAEWGRVIRWGGIQIERAWVEYDLTGWMTLRAGLFLTPYGIWNVDHGSPVIVGIRRPFTIREQLFPERQSGLELHGRRAWGAWSLGYHLTLSNGRGPDDTQFDFDQNKALGGRLVAERRGAQVLTFGLSFYRGLYTDRRERWVPTDRPHVARLERTIVQRFDDRSIAADLRFQGARLLFQSEAILNDRAHGDWPRPLAPSRTDRLAPDLRRWGAYGLLGYRTDLLSLMPYTLVELYELDSGAYPADIGHLPRALSTYLGINLRPEANLVLKVETWFTVFPGAAEDSWGRGTFSGLQAQVAWVF